MFPYDLQVKLQPYLKDMKPLPSIYYPEFIAANQSDRANNVINTGSKQKDLEKIREDIRNFKVGPLVSSSNRLSIWIYVDFVRPSRSNR